ncbi:MAG TPA: hypothetical protein VFC57_02275 [Aeromicrobium sp.]|nr:hypothetical protein [Aeromicrobium sp.]
MSAIDISDETFIVAPAALLQRELCDEGSWRPLGLSLTCYDDRGIKGKRWKLTGNLSGTAEVWLEPVGDGVTVHVFVQADPVKLRRWSNPQKSYSRRIKRRILDLKRHYDLERPAGMPAVRPVGDEAPEGGKVTASKVPTKES